MSGVVWVYIMLGIYIVYCFYWGLKGYFSESTSSGYAIADRSIPFFAFLLAATAGSFSGWTFIGHPGLIRRDGLAYALVSFYALTIPLTGAFFSKRTWLLGKRYGFITPGDMYAYYFNNETIRWVVAVIAVLYSVFYSAVQIMAAGELFHIITGVPFRLGAFFLAFIVWFYVCIGGLRASIYVGMVQFILLICGIIVLGFYTLSHPMIGGWTGFSEKVALLGPEFLEVPGIIHFGLEGGWTSVMILTYTISLMGIQSSPVFTLWTFSIKSPEPLAWQQTFMSTFVVGFALIFFTAFQGVGAKLLQNQGLEIYVNLTDRNVVPILMERLLPPAMLGLVFIGAIAAIHSTAAPYIGTCGSILLRDVYWRYIRKQNAGDAEQIWVNRILTTLVTLAALLIGLSSDTALVIMGALATAFGLLMYVLLMGVIWGFRFPAKGAVWGVIAGVAAVCITYGLWPNPLSMHCAFWGTFTGFIVAYLFRAIGIKDNPETRERQAEIRKWLDDVDAPSRSAKKWRKVMKFAVPLWFFFAMGPACILGNHAFSFSGFPPLWSWQIAWWILGIVMMWALCFKAEMSTADEIQTDRAEKEQYIVI